MTPRAPLTALAILMGAASANAQAANQADAPARAYVCTFDTTASTTFDPTAGDRSYEITAENFVMTFAAIDFSSHKAQLIGNQGAADVYAARGNGSTVFIETTLLGNTNLTTVIDRDVNGRIRAVTSRHTITFDGEAILSQMTGTCLAKN